MLTTVNHLNNDVWQLTAESRSGRREQLQPTGSHKFYSETRRDWVSTKEIHAGEVIRGRAGPLTLVDAHPLPGTRRVYNLTVEGEHVYYVSELGLLAHNNCPIREYEVLPLSEFNILANRGDDFDGHELLQSACLRRNLGADRSSSIGRRNPAIALSESQHTIVSNLQKEAGLHSGRIIDSQSARRNILENVQILKEAEVPREAILELLLETRRFAREIGL